MGKNLQRDDISVSVNINSIGESEYTINTSFIEAYVFSVI